MALLAGSAGVNGLADELYDALNTNFGGVNPDIDTDRKSFCNVLAATIIDHITTNAAVATTVAVTNVSGVTAGAATSGPGAGTGSGTVS
jgi:hypothetical protein